MKKIGSIIVSVMLVLCISFTFYGCGNDEKKIVGSWTCRIDYSEMLNKEEDMKSLFGDDFKFEDLEIELSFKFDEDGSAAMECDEESQKKFVDNFVDQIVDAMGDSLSAMGMSEEDIKEQFADSADGLTEELSNDDLYYKIEDGKLYMAEDEDELDGDDALCFEYEFDKKDTLVFKSSPTEGAEELFGEFPVTLTKKK